MAKACDETKKNKIKETLKQTAEKRKTQVCKVRTVKIVYSKLSKKQKEQLTRVFLESKWFYNYALNLYKSGTKLKDIDTKIKAVPVLVKKEIETRDLSALSSQSKQSIVDAIGSSLKTLKALKNNGYKTGELRFKSESFCVELKQYGTSHKVIDNKRLRIVNLKNLYVKGLSQIPSNAEYANAKLLKKPDGYYIALTVYTTPQKTKSEETETEIGIDLGIKTGVTLSDGRKFDSRIEESDRLKRLQKKFAKTVKRSNNSAKLLSKIRREHQKIANRRDDKANKIISEIMKYDKIYMQDENIKAWHHVFGKSVQRSVLGRVKSTLMSSSKTEVLKKFRPTTKWCSECNHLNKEIKLSDRVYTCPFCGYTEDRDIHAAKNMIEMVKQIKLGTYKEL